MLSILASYTPETFEAWFLNTAAFIGLGIVALVVIYKLFDWICLTGFTIAEELKKNNMAVAVVVASVLIAAALIIGKAIGM